ncbi:hypothetical protein TSAR_001147, partial [Trichomalopsis sarcophagae]
IQSWWEVPSIAHFCSLFRDAFNLLDFDIEDLEQALLTDPSSTGTEGQDLLQELIVRLLEGCLPDDTRNDISTFNYQMFLRRLFRKKCQEYQCDNPFNTDVDFELLPLRQKVEILRALCDFRLDAAGVEESLSDLDSDSLRVEPLGHDRKNSAYWYFYGTRLYREDYIDISNTVLSPKQKQNRPRDKRHKRCRSRLAKEEEEEEEKEEDCLVSADSEDCERESIWQVVCFTLQDWSRLVEKFKDSKHATERKLYKTLSQDFMPEIPKLFDLKEKQQRRKILQRNRARAVQSLHENDEVDEQSIMVKSKIKTKTNKTTKKSTNQTSKNAKTEVEVVPPPVQKKGRQTNNSLASAVGQILIDTRDEVTDVEQSKKGSGGKHGGSVSSGYGYGFNSIGIEEEEQQVGMHKVLNILKDHEDAWPFTDPVDEQYAPRYYSVIRRPMDLSKMEEKLEEGSYKTIGQFKRDFRLIIDNCKQYNGSDNEYTEMAMNLKDVFDRAVDRYLESEESCDDSLSCGSAASVNSPGYKSKNSSPSAIRHSQRHKHSRNKKNKLGNKSSKKKTRQRVYDEASVKEESEAETKAVKVKDKKTKKKTKKSKSEVKEELIDEEQENEGAISDTNVIKSKKKKSSDTDQRTVTKNSKKVLVKEELIAEEEPAAVKPSKKVKKDKEIRQGKAESRSPKELKENRKRKDDFEEDYDVASIAKSKSRKIEKKESKELDVLIDRVRKSKVKKEESPDRSVKEGEKLFSPTAVKKNRKANKEKSESPTKHNDKEKEKKSKKKSHELLKNGELKKECEVKSIERTTNANKSPAKKIESSVKNDTESLDSLKDRISERRREEKLKLEQEKKKKQSLKSDGFHGTSKKVPSNGSTYHNDVDLKLGSKKVKSKKTNKDEKNCESKSQNQEESEPKKIKTSYSKHTKGSGRRDPAIQALNQATEQTLNDINKWLDDAPKLSGFSSGNDSPVFHATTSSDSSRVTQSKHQQQSSAAGSTGMTSLSSTGAEQALSRKRPSSMKLLGPHAPLPLRPKKVQRTIDRLQPGKSKGNLLSKKPPSNDSAPTNDTANSQSASADSEQTSRESGDGPKLSLGTVLKNVDSIQLICKSLVSSPNPNLSNDEDAEEATSKPATPQGSFAEEQPPTGKKTLTTAVAKDEQADKKADSEENQKPKSATPNLSACVWGAKVIATVNPKKDEQVPESSGLGIGVSRQRRMSTGGSSVSESVSSFSQESPPSAGTGRSPHQSQQQALPSVMPSPAAAIEPQIRGAGFYQDALSTGSSPYNSPYYTTPPRYSAQLPPTPSPQNHPLSPAYPSSAAFDQAAAAQASQQPTPPSLYSQISPQTSHQSFQKPSPQSQSPTPFSQQSPQSEPQPYTAPALASSQSPVYPQQSPQSLQSSPYPQPSPQPANYSQPSPQTQPPTPGYSQPSPQTPTSNYSQPSPSQATSLNFSQPSPQQQHSPYSQSSPQPPPSYSQPSPQSQQHSPYSQPSPQQPNYSQVSPRPPSSTSYSQPSPQPPGYNAQTPSPYSQPDLVIAQPSPQPRGYSQTSPQQPPPNYSQPSPQTPSPYSAQPSPQQQPATYSQPSPQTPPSYSQPSPQQPRAYSLPSPQQPPTQQQSVSSVQQQQQISSYSQPSPQSQTQHRQQIQAGFAKSTEDYTQNLSTLPAFSQQVKSAYLQSSAASTPIVKPAATKDKQVQQQQSTAEQHLAVLNQQVYQSATSTQYSPNYPGNVFPSTDRMSSQLSTEPTGRSTTSRLTNHEAQQHLAQQRQAPNRLQSQQSQDQQSQLLSFQQNLASHESLYSSGFQTTPYPMPNAACRPVYPGYFDTSAKSTPSASSSGGSLAPVKKRMYNEPSTAPDAAAQRAPGQDQFGFDSLMALAHSQSDVPNQFDSSFASSLADSVNSNSPYARLQLGLVARSAKETQQLLSIPRPSGKNDPLAAYARSSAPGQSELDLNLLQSLQNAAAKNSGMLSMSRRVTEQPTPAQPTPAPKASKRSKKSKAQQQQQQQQQQLNVGIDQQTGIPGFPQYGSVGTDPIGSLKQSAVGGSAFNFATSAGTANSSPFYDKEATASAAAAAYAFLDDFRNPNLPNYYNMLRQQQQAAQAQQHQAQQQAAQQQQQQVTPVSDAAQQACNKLTSQTAARNYSSHPFLHSAQRPTPYGPTPVPYVTPHGANLSVDPAAYQQYLHSLYALQPPPQHRPTWL